MFHHYSQGRRVQKYQRVPDYRNGYVGKSRHLDIGKRMMEKRFATGSATNSWIKVVHLATITFSIKLKRRVIIYPKRVDNAWREQLVDTSSPSSIRISTPTLNLFAFFTKLKSKYFGFSV